MFSTEMVQLKCLEGASCVEIYWNYLKLSRDKKKSCVHPYNLAVITDIYQTF